MTSTEDTQINTQYTIRRLGTDAVHPILLDSFAAADDLRQQTATPAAWEIVAVTPANPGDQ